MGSSIDEDLNDEIIKSEDKQSDLSKTSELLLNEKFKRRKTILRGREVFPISRIDTFAQMWDVQFLKVLYDSMTEHLTSVGGQGRKDIVDITKFTIDKETQRNKEILEALGRR